MNSRKKIRNYFEEALKHDHDVSRFDNDSIKLVSITARLR